jgi:hypothetical protein
MMNYTNDTWIPVTSFLPHEYERVLVVCYNLQNHHDVHVSIATYWGKRNGQPLWSGKKKVSHWMPLPELPSGAPSREEV